MTPTDAAERAEHDRAALESDARLERMDRVAVLYGEITAATREFLRAVAECDKHGDWAEEGFGSCADWLAWRIGITRNTANEKVRAARALEELPLISDAMARGQLSFSKVRALTRAATPDNEAELLAYARACSAASLERLVRGWKTLGRLEEAKAERLRHRLRSLSVFPSEDGGMYVVKGVVTPEVGAVLMRAIEAASDALYRESSRDPVEGPEPEQLRADALGLVAEQALAAGFGRSERDTPLGDAPEPAGSDVLLSGSRAERYQVVLHVEPDTLRERVEPGMSELEDGTRVTAETARRLACDTALVEVQRAADGAVLDIGRRSRTVSPALRRALEVRDRGCRFPGCGLRFTAAHHIEHWADGGETSLRNAVLLCRRHHRLVHEEGYQISMDKDGQVVFFTPRGKPIAASPPPARLGADAVADPVRALVNRNRARPATSGGGCPVEPGWRSGLPTYRFERDIPWDIESAALEAMDDVLSHDVDEVA